MYSVPSTSEVVSITGRRKAVTGNVLRAFRLLASATSASKLKAWPLVTLASTVPESAPVAASSARPVGSAPLGRDHVNGDLPPLAANPPVAASPTVRSGRG